MVTSFHWEVRLKDIPNHSYTTHAKGWPTKESKGIITIFRTELVED